MQYLLLLVVIISIAAQSVLQKQYNKTSGRPKAFLFLTVTAVSAMLFFVLTSGGKLSFTMHVFWYSLVFAVGFISAMLGLFLSIKWGSMSISVLVNSYSLVIPTFYGVFFLKESLSVIGVVGIALLVISLFLIADRTQKAVFSLRWVIALMVSFLGNGLCSTMQKVQQIAFDGGYKNEFMIMGLAISAMVLLLVSVASREGVRDAACIGFGVLTGVANGLVNLLVLILTGLIPNAVLFPSVSAGGVVLGFLMARFVYHETLTTKQLTGYVLGALSVIAINL